MDDIKINAVPVAQLRKLAVTYLTHIDNAVKLPKKQLVAELTKIAETKNEKVDIVEVVDEKSEDIDEDAVMV